MNPRVLEIGFRKDGVTTPPARRLSRVNSKSVFLMLKRCFDIGGAVFGLIFSFPILVVSALFIKIDSPGGIFFRQVRVGKHGRLFVLYKLRSMVVDAEMNGPQWALRHDPRITPVGRIIRRYRIDEIPQFINVLRGEMSIIGPRPERPEFTLSFNKEIPGFAERLQVRPGITGWAQINGGYEKTPAEKLSLDLQYIDKMGVLLDLKILLKTVHVIFSGSGAR